MQSRSSLIPFLFLMWFSLPNLPACSTETPGSGLASVVLAEPLPPDRSQAAARLPGSFDQGAAYLRELRVHPEGDDVNGDGSFEAPFLTLGRALQAASPGTRVLMAPGRYAPTGTVTDLQGQPGAPIAIVGDEGAVIDGRLAEGVITGLHLMNPRYVVVEGLTVEYTYPHGISIDDGGDYATPAGPVVLRGLNIRNVGRGGNNDCLKMSGVDHFQILDSEFANCDEGEAIDLVGCHEGLIAGNTFRSTPLTAVQTKGGSSDIVIHGNRFIEVTARSVNLGGHTGTPYFRPPDAPYEAARIQALSNTFYRPGDTAIAFTGCIDCVAAHNTIVEPRRHVVRLLEEHPELATGRNGQFINNLVVFRSSEVERLVTVGRNTIPDSFTLGWNLWYAADRPGFEGIRHDRRLPPERFPVLGRDPGFVDPAKGDYRIQTDSPARAAGRVLAEPLQLPDYHGRPFGRPPAIGAHAAP